MQKPAQLKIVNRFGVTRSLPLGKPVFTIGRKAENDLQLLSDSVSRQHAEIVYEDEAYYLVDIGSKRGTGAYAFKARWGMTEVPLAYQYHLVRAKELPNVSPANPKYQALIELWKRMPLPLTRLLGPRIIRRIP